MPWCQGYSVSRLLIPCFEVVHPRCHYGYFVLFLAGSIYWWTAGGATFGIGYFTEDFINSGFSRTGISGAWTVAMLSTALTLPLIGRCVDWWGPRVVMMALSLIFISAFPIIRVANNLPLITFGFYVVRVGMASLQLVGSNFVNQWWVQSKAKAMAVSNATGSLALFYPTFLAALKRHWPDWRDVMIVEAIMCGIILLFVSIFALNRPETYGYFPDGERNDGTKAQQHREKLHLQSQTRHNGSGDTANTSGGSVELGAVKVGLLHDNHGGDGHDTDGNVNGNGDGYAPLTADSVAENNRSSKGGNRSNDSGDKARIAVGSPHHAVDSAIDITATATSDQTSSTEKLLTIDSDSGDQDSALLSSDRTTSASALLLSPSMTSVALGSASAGVDTGSSSGSSDSTTDHTALVTDGRGRDGLEGNVVRSAEDEIHWHWRDALRTRAFWTVTLSACSTSLLWAGFNFHYKSIFEDRGIDASVGDYIFLPTALGSFITMFIAGYMFDRIQVKSRGMMLGTLTCMVALIMLATMTTTAEAYIFSFIYGVMDGILTVGYMTVFAYTFGRVHLGTIDAIAGGINTSVIGVGALLFGLAREYIGNYESLLIALACVTGLMSILLYFSKPPPPPTRRLELVRYEQH